MVFPILTIALLDLYPSIRGTASSMQAFVSLMSNAIIAGVLAPLVSKSPLAMAKVACVFVVIGYFFWWRYQKNTPVPIDGAEQAMAYEPTDEL